MASHVLVDAKYRPVGAAGDAEGLRNATSSSTTDVLTREHRMTIDEARLILNVKKEEPAEIILQVESHCYALPSTRLGSLSIFLK
jgi:import inner membrane translocase subunit TIM16